MPGPQVGVNIIDWHTVIREPVPFKEQDRNEKLDQKYSKALNRVKKNNQSLHNKVFDQVSGKFVEFENGRNHNSMVPGAGSAGLLVHDSNLFI